MHTFNDKQLIHKSILLLSMEPPRERNLCTGALHKLKARGCCEWPHRCNTCYCRARSTRRFKMSSCVCLHLQVYSCLLLKQLYTIHPIRKQTAFHTLIFNHTLDSLEYFRVYCVYPYYNVRVRDYVLYSI